MNLLSDGRFNFYEIGAVGRETGLHRNYSNLLKLLLEHLEKEGLL